MRHLILFLGPPLFLEELAEVLGVVINGFVEVGLDGKVDLAVVVDGIGVPGVLLLRRPVLRRNGVFFAVNYH